MTSYLVHFNCMEQKREFRRLIVCSEAELDQEISQEVSRLMSKYNCSQIGWNCNYNGGVKAGGRLRAPQS
jgi:hypothetical protein